MGKIAAGLSDLAIVTSDNPRSEEPQAIVDQILEGIGETPVEVELDRRTVIAGKGHEQGQEIAGRLLPFDDREVAGELLEALGTKR